MSQNRRVVCWGYDPTYSGFLEVPNDLYKVKQISAGGNHLAALMDNGTVRCWGENMKGQCKVPKDLTEVKKVCAGQEQTVALLNDGTIRCWGKPFVSEHLSAPFPEELTTGRGEKVIDISASIHAAAVLADGTARVWGCNQHSQCDGFDGIDGIQQIVTGSMHTILLRQDGVLGAGGLNANGQCDIKRPSDSFVVKQIDADTHTVILFTNGKLGVTGNSNGASDDWLPVCPNNEHLFFNASGPIAQIATGWFRTVVLYEGEFDETTPLSKQISCFGYSKNGRCDVPDDLGKVIQISAGDNFTAALVE